MSSRGQGWAEDMSYRHVQKLASSNSYSIELPVIDCPLSANCNWDSGSTCKCLGHIKCVSLCWVLHYYGMQLALRVCSSFSYKTCLQTKELSCFMSNTTLLHDESCFELLCLQTGMSCVIWGSTKVKGSELGSVHSQFTCKHMLCSCIVWSAYWVSVSPSTGSLAGGIFTTLSSLSRSIMTVPSWR